jgi:hypothetical protein
MAATEAPALRAAVQAAAAVLILREEMRLDRPPVLPEQAAPQ